LGRAAGSRFGILGIRETGGSGKAFDSLFGGMNVTVGSADGEAFVERVTPARVQISSQVRTVHREGLRALAPPFEADEICDLGVTALTP
jgi:hypothetical protein